MHVIQAVLVIGRVAFVTPPRGSEGRHIVRADDEERSTGIGALPCEMQLCGRFLVRPPGADHVRVLDLGIRAAEPGRAGESRAVHLAPGRSSRPISRRSVRPSCGTDSVEFIRTRPRRLVAHNVAFPSPYEPPAPVSDFRLSSWRRTTAAKRPSS